MKVYGYSRPALLLGFVLAPLLESYLFISLNTYGPLFFMRPISLVITLLILVGMLLPVVRYFRARNKNRSAKTEKAG